MVLFNSLAHVECDVDIRGWRNAWPTGAIARGVRKEAFARKHYEALMETASFDLQFHCRQPESICSKCGEVAETLSTLRFGTSKGLK